METIDPATGRPLPSDAIQRILFVAPSAHIYNIPPLTSTRGYSATSWTADPSRHIFTARLRLVETSNPEADPSLKVDAVLEDPSTGQLFAAAPYTHAGIVEPVLDSSRFFAVTVRDPQGRKAVLGVGFEERSDAFDFGVALQEARKALGVDGTGGGVAATPGKADAGIGAALDNGKDYSLKEGETITVNLKAGRRRQRQASPQSPDDKGNSDLQSFAIPPPPPPSSSVASTSGGFALPPPPSAQDVKTKRRSIRDLGFDDGQFGEFA